MLFFKKPVNETGSKIKKYVCLYNNVSASVSNVIGKKNTGIMKIISSRVRGVDIFVQLWCIDSECRLKYHILFIVFLFNNYFSTATLSHAILSLHYLQACIKLQGDP